MRLILPKTYVRDIDNALIFLAGPIACAPLWQDKAIEIIHSKNPDIYIASPSKKLRMEYLDKAMPGDKTKFPKQLDWERYYLELASKKGVILFWLPKEKQHSCEKTYTRDTTGELGEWRGRLIYDKNIKLVIGGEVGFDGLDIIKRNYLAVKPDMKFHSGLEETCEEAVSLACRK